MELWARKELCASSPNSEFGREGEAAGAGLGLQPRGPESDTQISLWFYHTLAAGPLAEQFSWMSTHPSYVKWGQCYLLYPMITGSNSMMQAKSQVKVY